MIMANTYTNSVIHNIGLNEENSLSHLLERISPEIENETDLIEHSECTIETFFIFYLVTW